MKKVLAIGLLSSLFGGCGYNPPQRFHAYTYALSIKSFRMHYEDSDGQWYCIFDAVDAEYARKEVWCDRRNIRLMQYSGFRGILIRFRFLPLKDVMKLQQRIITGYDFPLIIIVKNEKERMRWEKILDVESREY